MAILPNLPNVTSNATPPLWVSVLFTQPPRDEMAYYAAFGRFVAAFALADSGLHIVARHFSGMLEDKARMVFGGYRTNDLAWVLRRFTENTPQYPEIDALLKQLEDISKERDKFVHRLVEYDSKEGFKVTNKLTVRSLDKVEQHKFNISDLKAMEDDCNQIFFRFGVLCNQLDGAMMAKKGISLLGLGGPWQYKRPPQGHPKKQHS